MSVLLQVSDTHFGTERPGVVDALLRLAQQQRPEVVVLSGDITQRARRRQFDAAQAFAARLDAPVVAIAGNHDIPLFDLPARAFWPYAGHRRAFGADLEPVYASARWLVLGVRTTRRYRHKNGEVSAAQIERISGRLQSAAPGQLRVVVVHHPIAASQPGDLRHRLRGHAAALGAWGAAGADVVMGGHVHLPYVLPLEGAARRLWAVQAGTAVSTRLRDGIPNSVNLLRWGEGAPAGACLVERWDHDDGAEAFLRQGVTTLEPAR